MPESVKAKETAKKKVTRKANPEETLVRGPMYPVEGDVPLAKKTLQSVDSSDEVLAHGYHLVEGDLDMFDNERNYKRVRPELGEKDDPEVNERAYNFYDPAPGYGAKKKVLDQDGEDYGHEATKSGDRQDD